jgi:hypothetical protein
MVKGVDQRARAVFQQAEVVNHLAVIERMRFEQQFDLVRMAVDRVRAAPRAAAAHDVGVLELEQLADQHALVAAGGSRFFTQVGDDVGQRQAAEILACARAQCDAAFRFFPIADDEQVRHFLQRVLANLVADFLVAQIGRRARRPASSAFNTLSRVVGLTFADVEYDGLLRRQPEREEAGCSARSGCR